MIQTIHTVELQKKERKKRREKKALVASKNNLHMATL